MAPLGCLPIARALSPDNTGACVEELSTLAKLHNEALSKSLQELENQLDGFKYAIADTYTSLSESINNPSKYGMSIIFVVHNEFYYCWSISISLAKISFLFIFREF